MKSMTFSNREAMANYIIANSIKIIKKDGYTIYF